MDEEPPIPFEHRLVADGDLSRAMARSFLRRLVRRPGFWLANVLVWVAIAGVLYLVYDDALSVGTRLFGSVVLALIPAMAVIGLGLRGTYVNTERNLRARAFDGAALESGFGPDAFVYRSPLATTRTRYSGIQSIELDAQFVFLRYEGSSALTIYPRALFPDEAIARMRAGR